MHVMTAVFMDISIPCFRYKAHIIHIHKSLCVFRIALYMMKVACFHCRSCFSVDFITAKLNNNQPDPEENADVAPPAVPTFPPIELTNMVAQIQPVVANPNSTAQRLTTRSRMKIKDCGVRGNKLVFIQPEHVAKYPDKLIDGSVILDGTITTTLMPRKTSISIM